MFFKRFKYDVKAKIELNGSEIFVIYLCSKHHYDGVCKAISQPGGWLYGMINHLQFGIKGRESTSVPEAMKTPRVFVEKSIFELDGDQIQIALKCLELAKNLEDARLKGFELTLILKDILTKVYEESARINGENLKGKVDE